MLHQGLDPQSRTFNFGTIGRSFSHRISSAFGKVLPESLVDSMSISGYPDRPGAYMKSVPGGTAGIARCWDLGIRE